MPMARKAANTPKTSQVNFRFRDSTLERADAFRARNPLNLSLTQMTEAALLEWLDRNEPLLPPLKTEKPKGK